MGLDGTLGHPCCIAGTGSCRPYCGLLMANAGARVIKVERPEETLPEVMFGCWWSERHFRMAEPGQGVDQPEPKGR